MSPDQPKTKCTLGKISFKCQHPLNSSNACHHYHHCPLQQQLSHPTPTSFLGALVAWPPRALGLFLTVTLQPVCRVPHFFMTGLSASQVAARLLTAKEVLMCDKLRTKCFYPWCSCLPFPTPFLSRCHVLYHRAWSFLETGLSCHRNDHRDCSSNC